VTQEPHAADEIGAATLLWWVYALLVVAGLIVLNSRIGRIEQGGHPVGFFRQGSNYVAARDLKPNHRLRRRDFKPREGLPAALAVYLPDPKDYVGTYLRRETKAGSAITPDDLLPQPIVKLAEGKDVRAVSLSDQVEALQWLEAGTAVRIRFADGKSSDGKVVALTCAQPEDSTGFDPKACAALIEISPATDLDQTKWRLEPAK